jgi:hypothetical protein
MNGFEIFSILAIFLVIRFILPMVLVFSIGSLLKNKQPA